MKNARKNLSRLSASEERRFVTEIRRSVRKGAVFSELVEEFEGQWAHDPHWKGWLLQELRRGARAESFEAHHHYEAKHKDTVVASQIFTPAWVADALAARCLEHVDAARAICLDPCCGAGQMLFAWVRAKVSGGASVEDAVLSVRGVDLDPEAVALCREALAGMIRAEDKVVSAQIQAALHENIKVADGLEGAPKCDVVLMNPPYMGLRSMDEGMRSRVKEHGEFGVDLYSAFIDHAQRQATAVVGVLAPQTIWFTQRFERARRSLLKHWHLDQFLHLGSGLFPGLTGEKSSAAAFVLSRASSGTTEFYDLRSGKGEDKEARYESCQPLAWGVEVFNEIPGAPLAHWLKDEEIALFSTYPPLEELFEVPGSQNKTGDNARFVRPVNEVFDELVPVWGLDGGNPDGRYRYYSKGGPYCPWWGNWDWAVDFSDEAKEFYRTNRTSNLMDESFLERNGLCYTDFGGRRFSARFMPKGVVFDMAGPAIFSRKDDDDELFALLVYLNSDLANRLLVAMNPSLHFQVRDVRALPLPPLTPEMSDLGRTRVEEGSVLLRRTLKSSKMSNFR